MSNLSETREVFEGVATRHEMYALFNRDSQAPFDDDRASGSRYAGDWFEIAEAEHDHMLDILPPLFQQSEMFAVRELLAASVTSVFFYLRIDGRLRWFHGYCDLADTGSPQRMRAAIIERESRPVWAMTRLEKLDHIWSTTGADFRAYADLRLPIVSCIRRGMRSILSGLRKSAPPHGSNAFSNYDVSRFALASSGHHVRSRFRVAHRSPDRARRGSPVKVALWGASLEDRCSLD